MAASCGAEPPAAGPVQEAGTIGVDGADLFYQSLGSGRPIVVVHGGPGLDHSYLRPWLEPLAERYRIVLYDQRGVGQSPAALDTAVISMSNYLRDLDTVRVRVARRERVTLLAHSWGAVPALLYALRWPDRVDGLILVSPVEPGQRYAARAAENQRARRSPADSAAIDSLLRTPAYRAGDPRTVSRVFFHVFRGTFGDPARADSGFAVRLAERTARQGRQVAELLMRPLAGLDLWEEIARLPVPTLIIHGGRDPTPVEMVRELESTLPNAALVLIEEAGHFPFVESPAAFRAAVDAFVRSLDESS